MPLFHNHHLMDINTWGILCPQPACTCFLPAACQSSLAPPTTASDILRYIINAISLPHPVLNAIMPPAAPALPSADALLPPATAQQPATAATHTTSTTLPGQRLQRPAPTHTEPPHSLLYYCVSNGLWVG
ncbi:hypothetical protein DFH08DRAFT_805987 [Mycena albidolilacea]|uniref:Uncharacterized protein n=1 Tax=Mycena albidolilacea TaxID=1033008 RepID=A0AAD7A898_9AGAR|nr:hypothetical protein DFH08DRAFT_805987 [Mycena albidolilacea]